MGEGGGTLEQIEQLRYDRSPTYGRVRQAVLAGISNTTDVKRGRILRYVNAAISRTGSEGGVIFSTDIKEGGDFNPRSVINILDTLQMLKPSHGIPGNIIDLGSSGPDSLRSVLGGLSGKAFTQHTEDSSRRKIPFNPDLAGLTVQVDDYGGEKGHLSIRADGKAIARMRGQGYSPQAESAKAPDVAPRLLDDRGILDPRRLGGLFKKKA